jgi:hypothetical protein
LPLAKLTPFVAVSESDEVWDRPYHPHILHKKMEVIIMNWEAPSFVEIKMDSEINSYQDDFKEIPEVQEQTEDVSVSTDHN